MQSRTEDGKHTPRFIVEIVNTDNKRYRSGAVPKAFATRAEAQAAVDANGIPGVTYKIRQK